MAAAGAVAGLGIAGLNRLLEQGIDPEKLLDLAIEDMQEDLVKSRQAVIPVMATQKRFQQQYEQAETDVNKWHNRTQLAVKKGDDYLAREALLQKEKHQKNAELLKAHIEQQKTKLDTFKQNLVAFDSKISEAKAFKARLKRLIASIKANSHLQNTIGNLGTSSAMGAFERMEEKVRMMEAKSQSAAELAGADLESQFKMLESGSGIDDELAAMKAQMLGLTPIPAVNPTTSFQSVTPVDAELEELRRQINQY
ncbi:MAG: PspA/IM30 family protein [Cyanosarcina radialis HA8281-LM2]|nr:PspA/IM30 family protein [Cyanosarcina radialis HA8281-LM2]